MRCLVEFIAWKKVLVRAFHLFLVFLVIASLLFQPSGNYSSARNCFFFFINHLHLDLRTALYDGSNYFYCLAYGVLVYLSIFFYFMTCYIDPGYVPYKRVRSIDVMMMMFVLSLNRYRIGREEWLRNQMMRKVTILCKNLWRQRRVIYVNVFCAIFK